MISSEENAPNGRSAVEAKDFPKGIRAGGRVVVLRAGSVIDSDVEVTSVNQRELVISIPGLNPFWSKPVIELRYFPKHDIWQLLNGNLDEPRSDSPNYTVTPLN
jgi:hypothetical protein